MTFTYAIIQAVISEDKGSLWKTMYMLYMIKENYNLKISTDQIKVLPLQILVTAKIQIIRSSHISVQNTVYF
jgi:ribosomal protein S3AE